MKRLLIPVGVALVIVVALLVLFLHQSSPPLPLNQTFINSTFGPGEILPTSGTFKLVDGNVIIHQQSGNTLNTTLALLGVGIYLPSQVKSGLVEYVNGTGYHLYVVVLQLQNVVSSNYTQTINGNKTTIIIVHRGYAEADLFYFGGNLTPAQDKALISVLSRYLENL